MSPRAAYRAARTAFRIERNGGESWAVTYWSPAHKCWCHEFTGLTHRMAVQEQARLIMIRALLVLGVPNSMLHDLTNQHPAGATLERIESAYAGFINHMMGAPK